MNAQGAALGLTDTHFVRPDGLDAPAHVLERARRDAARAGRDAEAVRPRDRAARSTARSRAGATLHTWNDLLATFPGVIGVKTGHTDGAGWSQVAAARAAA